VPKQPQALVNSSSASVNSPASASAAPRLNEAEIGHRFTARGAREGNEFAPVTNRCVDIAKCVVGVGEIGQEHDATVVVAGLAAQRDAVGKVMAGLLMVPGRGCRERPAAPQERRQARRRVVT